MRLFFLKIFHLLWFFAGYLKNYLQPNNFKQELNREKILYFINETVKIYNI